MHGGFINQPASPRPAGAGRAFWPNLSIALFVCADLGAATEFGARERSTLSAFSIVMITVGAALGQF